MGLAAEVGLIVAGSIGAAVCLAALAERLPASGRPFESVMRPPVETSPWPAQLVRLERIVQWSESSGPDAHARLRPVLIEIADARLARRGLRRERDVHEIRDLLGVTAWGWVRPDRPPPDRDAAGISPGDLEAILDALESL